MMSNMTSSGRPARPPRPSYLQTSVLLEKKGIDLPTWLAEQRTAGLTIEDIAHELYLVSERAISVSYRTVYRWLEDLELIEAAS